MKPNQNEFTNGATHTEKPPLVMSALKTETMSAHKQLERTNYFIRLFEPDYSIQEYRRLLCRFYGFFSAIEPLIFENLTETQLSVLGHKVKVGLLAKDISLFEGDEAGLQNMPRCDKLPRLNSFARQMGAFYVLEGSTLGGRIIAKRLKEHFGTEILDKLNYYNCYGENISVEWKGFQSFMGSQFDDKEAEIPDVIAAANDTFLCLHQWFDKP